MHAVSDACVAGMLSHLLGDSNMFCAESWGSIFQLRLKHERKPFQNCKHTRDETEAQCAGPASCTRDQTYASVKRIRKPDSLWTNASFKSTAF